MSICPYGWKWDHENAECVPGPYAVTSECPPGYEFSVSQKRCVKLQARTEVKCWPGTQMNPATGKCEPVYKNVVAYEAPTHQQPGPVSICPEGQVWNPVINRCGDPDRAARMQRTSGVDLWGGVAQVRRPAGSENMPRYANAPKAPSTATAIIAGTLGGLVVGYLLWRTAR